MKILIAELEYPVRTEELVNNFIKEFGQHHLADDVLAVQVYINSYIIQDFRKAESFNLQLRELYPNGNALDNAQYWLTYGYAHSYLKENYQIAISRYYDVINAFPESRFAKHSLDNINQINETLENEDYFDKIYGK